MLNEGLFCCEKKEEVLVCEIPSILLLPLSVLCICYHCTCDLAKGKTHATYGCNLHHQKFFI